MPARSRILAWAKWLHVNGGAIPGQRGGVKVGRCDLLDGIEAGRAEPDRLDDGIGHESTPLPPEAWRRPDDDQAVSEPLSSALLAMLVLGNYPIAL